MRTIWKYPLPKPGQSIAIAMPAAARFIHVALQGGAAMLWVEVLAETKAFHRKFWCFGTGWEIPDGLTHIGTVIDAGGFVWHFYNEPLEVPETW